MHPRTWPLARTLLVSVALLALILTLFTAGVTTLQTRRVLVGQVDAQLQEQAAPLGDRHDGDDLGGLGPCVRGGPGRGESSVTACYSGATSTGVLVSDYQRVQLTQAQLSDLSAATRAGEPVTVEVAGLGSYRALAKQTSSGVTVVSGLPLRFADRAARQLVTAIVLASLLGLLVVLAVGRWLIRRNLQPLNRVAGVAHRVSGQQLRSGDVVVHERVAQRDTNPGTEVGQVGLALNELLDNVEDALQARQASEMRVRQFVADASHELRTPLASVRGYAELSKREQEPVPPNVQRALTRIESESLRMQGLVEDMLLLARLDAGRPLEREPVDLTMLAMTTVEDARAAAPEHRWRLDLPEEPIEVVGDQARLTQVLVNLLANARVHTPAGTTVTTRLSREDADHVRLAVHDDGPGVPEALQASVFQRFARGDDSRARSSGSTGLGLSIVESVVAAHGGRVELASRPGATTFSVVLPG